MTTFAAFKLIQFGEIPWIGAAFALCILLPAGAEFLALKRCEGFGRWLFPGILLELWLLGEWLSRFFFRTYIRGMFMWALVALAACLLGTLLGAAAYLVVRALGKKGRSMAE